MVSFFQLNFKLFSFCVFIQKSGEKPYKCEYPGCTKMFDQSSNLNKHYLTHMGQKPYQCNDCGDKFSQTSNLAKHMRKHGRIDCNSPSSLSTTIVDQSNHQIPMFMMTDNKRNSNSIQSQQQHQQQLTAITTSNCYHTNGQNNVNHHYHHVHLLHDPNNQQSITTHTSSSSSDQLAATAMALFSNHNHSNHSRSSITPVFISDTNKFISGLFARKFSM